MMNTKLNKMIKAPRIQMNKLLVKPMELVLVLANADEYAMHALVGYEPPIDCGIPMSPFERLKINCLDNMVNNQRNHYEFYVARFQHLDEQIEVVRTQRFEYGKDD
ncbi:hypothetical protein ACSQ67_024691 [Phaseolus vulgaris]